MPEKPTSGGRAALADAAPVRGRSSVAPKGGANGGPPNWPGVGLPEGCPVRAVGVQKMTCIVLDKLGQLIEAGPRDLGRNHISALFGGEIGYLAAMWPVYDKDGNWKPTKFAAEDVSSAIQLACAEAGVWENFEKVRGRGAWVGAHGELVLHCGDLIVFGAAEAREGKPASIERREFPDVHDGHVYPAGGPILQPLTRTAKLRPAHDADAAGPTLLRMFKTWNWYRPVLDPRLFLGAMVSSMLGGALPWRPSCWVTGESGSGKTTLMDLRRDTVGAWNLQAENVSESGLSTLLGFDSIGVSLDEQENSQDNRRLEAIVQLMRLAASGGLKVRGSSSHTAHTFRSRNAFVASSINAAPLKNQDMNRMARLELDVLPKGAVAPDWSKSQALGWGAEILRRALDQWGRFEETLATYQGELQRAGHDQRGQDTFGVLLACADLVMAEECMLDTGADPDRAVLFKLLEASTMPEYTDRMKSWEACLQHLLFSRPRDWKSPSWAMSIAGVCASFLRYILIKDKDGHSRSECNAMLALAGLVIFQPHQGPMAGKWCLGVPNNHPALSPIFDATDWRSEPSTVGGWIAALGRAPGDVVCRKAKFRVDGKEARGVAIAISEVVAWKDELPGDAPEGAAS